MATIYRKQPVMVMRDAHKGDHGFDEDSKVPQILIKHADGAQTVVPKDQVEDDTPKAKPVVVPVTTSVVMTATTPPKPEVTVPRTPPAPAPTAEVNIPRTPPKSK